MRCVCPELSSKWRLFKNFSSSPTRASASLVRSSNSLSKFLLFKMTLKFSLTLLFKRAGSGSKTQILRSISRLGLFSPQSEISPLSGLCRRESNLISVLLPLPFLPMILAVVFSHYAITSIKLDISAIIIISVVIAMIFEAIRCKFKFDVIADGLKAFFNAMGKSLSGVVVLIIAAGVFAEGFKALGMIDAIIKLANTLGLAGFGMSVLFVVITTLVTIISGSNGASFYPLIEMVPQIASKLNVSSVMLVLPMHQASTIARPISPVSGVVIAIAGMLKCSPMDIVKRCSVPAILGLVSHHIFVFLLSL